MIRVGSVAELWRFPVKSMQGEQLDEVTVTSRGVLGDRAFALVDKETGKVASAKSVKMFPDLLACRATYVETPGRDDDLPPVRIDLPNGRSVRSDDPAVDRELSAHFGREVRLARVAPDDFTIDMYQPDIEGANPGGQPGSVVAQKLGAALFAEFGLESPLPAGSFLDAFPLSVITTSTLAHLNARRPDSRFDPRRFRMNLLVATEQLGFVENAWVSHEVGIGASARIMVTMPDARCVMTTLAQGDLPDDRDILRTLVEHNRIPVGPLGELPCAGVYGVTAAPGIVRIGDPVMLS